MNLPDRLYAASTRLRDGCHVAHLMAAKDLLREAAREIERLKAENDAFREQFAEADEIEELINKYGFPPPGWERVDL